MSTLENPSGFDVENISLPSNSGVITGLMPYDCETNFQLDSLLKFNMLQHCLSSFYITLLAHDPAIHPLEKPFPVKVDEEKNTLFAYYMHHFQMNPKKPFVAHFHDAAKEDGLFKGELLADSFFKGELPDWPSDDALNNGKRFYLVKESEWQANDWIPMYLELVICADARLVAKRDVVSKLAILEVAIETGIEDMEPPNERLKATRANVYIKCKGLANVCSPRMIFESGEHVERKAVVRRVLDEDGYLTISGKFCGGQSTQKQPSVALHNEKKIQSSKKRPRSD
ncbi:hypothetical protein YC2023_083684 [Brassica napus]